MADRPICSIEGCGKPAICRGWCDMHYTRYKRHGDPLVTKTAAEGDGLSFLMARLSYSGRDCVEWPYSKSGLGYGQTFYQGQVRQTHRLMCFLAHGEPPTPKHHAAHRCGNYACINPRHIRWRTPRQNIAEKKRHGREAFGEARPSAKLNDSKVREIIALEGQVPCARVAAKFAVASPTIKAIWDNKTWRHIPRD